MKILILYDSPNGNTKIIAESVAHAFEKTNSVRLEHVSHSSLSDLALIDCLFVGSPTYGGRPTEKIQMFLDSIPASALKDIRVAAFDTRFSEEKVNFALRLLMKTIDYAAPKILKNLTAKGGVQLLPPVGFIVTGKEGPLQKGESDRVAVWVKSTILAS